MKRLSRLLILATLPCILPAHATDLQTGDIIFVADSHSDFSQAITSATATDSLSVQFSHVGIINVVGPDQITVIEASPQRGVCEVSLPTFLNECPTADNHPAVVVKRLDIPFDAMAVIKTAKSFIGQPYDWRFLPDNGAMYCSELIYESYLTNDGQHIFPATPMNFRNPDGTMAAFWTDLFSRLGCDPPEGVPGTNPNGLANDPRLTNILIFN